MKRPPWAVIGSLEPGRPSITPSLTVHSPPVWIDADSFYDGEQRESQWLPPELQCCGIIRERMGLATFGDGGLIQDPQLQVAGPGFIISV